MTPRTYWDIDSVNKSNTDNLNKYMGLRRRRRRR
jgi:hypothetical protein